MTNNPTPPPRSESEMQALVAEMFGNDATYIQRGEHLWVVKSRGKCFVLEEHPFSWDFSMRAVSSEEAEEAE